MSQPSSYIATISCKFSNSLYFNSPFSFLNTQLTCSYFSSNQPQFNLGSQTHQLFKKYITTQTYHLIMRLELEVHVNGVKLNTQKTEERLMSLVLCWIKILFTKAAEIYARSSGLILIALQMLSPTQHCWVSPTPISN